MISMNSNQTAMGYEWNEFQIDTNITNQKRLMLRRISMELASDLPIDSVLVSSFA